MKDKSTFFRSSSYWKELFDDLNITWYYVQPGLHYYCIEIQKLFVNLGSRIFLES